MYHVTCKCGKKVVIPASLLGELAECPRCQQTLRVVLDKVRDEELWLDVHFMISDGPDRFGEMIFIGGAGAIEIGKRPVSQLILISDTVSRQHAKLAPSEIGAGWRVIDTGSTHGVHVNGVRVAQHDLQLGDKLRLGEYALRLRRTADLETGVADEPDIWRPRSRSHPLLQLGAGD